MGGCKLLQLHLHVPCWQMCGLTWYIAVTRAGLITVLSLNICKLLMCRYRKEKGDHVTCQNTLFSFLCLILPSHLYFMCSPCVLRYCGVFRTALDREKTRDLLLMAFDLQVLMAERQVAVPASEVLAPTYSPKFEQPNRKSYCCLGA
jgi:hypothetical protein